MSAANPLLSTLDLRGCVGDDIASLLPKPADPGADVREPVAEILKSVRHGGDEALIELTRRLDHVVDPRLSVSADELASALDAVPAELRRALEIAWERIVDYHGAREPNPAPWASGGIAVHHLRRPVQRAGIYAPGGLARYPSTVLMCAAPARVAGVPEIVLCVPPRNDGSVDEATLAAAAIAGVDEVHPVGGAQAIGAMAYGTESIHQVDVIAGPGNVWVAEAKRQVSGTVGVASAFAGPSEVVVVADRSGPAVEAAIDLVLQAEHGPDGMAWLIAWDEAVVDAVGDEVERIVAASDRRSELEATLGKNGWACLVDGPTAAIAIANVVAPEHLELLVDPEMADGLLEMVQSAGAVFVGRWSPASLGDYLAGPNHVLPTNRTARFASALRAADFEKEIHVVRATENALRDLGPHVVTLAEAEGLPAHADSIRVRLNP